MKELKKFIAAWHFTKDDEYLEDEHMVKFDCFTREEAEEFAERYAESNGLGIPHVQQIAEFKINGRIWNNYDLICDVGGPFFVSDFHGRDFESFEYFSFCKMLANVAKEAIFNGHWSAADKEREFKNAISKVPMCAR